jgi:hypothetical protein
MDMSSQTGQTGQLFHPVESKVAEKHTEKFKSRCVKTHNNI